MQTTNLNETLIRKPNAIVTLTAWSVPHGQSQAQTPSRISAMTSPIRCRGYRLTRADCAASLRHRPSAARSSISSRSPDCSARRMSQSVVTLIATDRPSVRSTGSINSRRSPCASATRTRPSSSSRTGTQPSRMSWPASSPLSTPGSGGVLTRSMNGTWLTSAITRNRSYRCTSPDEIRMTLSLAPVCSCTCSAQSSCSAVIIPFATRASPTCSTVRSSATDRTRQL